MNRVLARVMLAAVMMLAALLPACSDAPEPDGPPPLRVGWFLWPGWYPIAIAQEKGIFARHGVNVEPVLYASYTDIFSDFAAGKLHAAHGGLYELLKSGIPDIRVVLATDYSDGAEGLIVTPDIRTPADLAGKRIGIQGGLSGSEFIVTTLLRRHGLSRNDLSLVDVGPEIVLDTMPERIDGGYTWEPFLSKAREKGYRVLFTTADTPGMIPDVIAFQGAVVRDRAADVQAFADAWFEAQRFWMENRAEGDAIIAAATGQKVGDISLEGCRPLSREDNRKAFAPAADSASLYDIGAKQIDFFISVGDASTAPDLKEVLVPAFVQGSGKR